MTRASPEHELQKDVCWHLRMRAKPNVSWFAVPNASRRSPRQGAWMKAEGLRAGVADLIFCIAGQPWALELKAGKNTTTEAQDIWAAEWIRAGGSYATATGIDEALAALERMGAIHPDASKVAA